MAKMSKFYFLHKNDLNCYTKEAILERIKREGLTEIEVEGAKRETGTDYFYCSHYGEVGEKGNCSNGCDGYSPRNGKAGCCRHFGFCYVPDGNKTTLKV